MPTYEYECRNCGLRFERRQSMTDRPLAECPECRGEVRRLVSGGAGFIIKGSDRRPVEHSPGSCSLEQSGKTCCGRAARCEKPPCGEES
ncbi:MAG: zinc ribbon domain-containing protein [Candidatus Aminicenantes bacterium]|nr:zinc ribbon domain-containing protein [Candidatus Aminicenantes bacterium]